MERELNIYFSFITYAICGRMAEADQLLSQYRELIQCAGSGLLGHIPIGRIHRGLILKESGASNIKPDLGRTFLSFSEDVQVAKHFADPDPLTGFGFGGYGLGSHGYLITHVPERREILFHHQILHDRELHNLISNGVKEITGAEDGELELKTILTQKEVILINSGQVFDITRFERDEEYLIWAIKRKHG